MFYPFCLVFKRIKQKRSSRSAFDPLPPSCHAESRASRSRRRIFDRLHSSLPKSPLPSQNDKHSDLTAHSGVTVMAVAADLHRDFLILARHRLAVGAEAAFAARIALFFCDIIIASFRSFVNRGFFLLVWQGAE
jgi:hypothetical protein